MMPLLFTLFGSLTGCSIVLLDNPCDTGVEEPDPDTGSPTPDRFIDAGTGGGHTCGILMDGSIQCWGSNEDRQLNAPLGQFSSIYVGHAHACALDERGAVACWGRNDHGQTSLSGVYVAVAAGGAHTCGLQESGAVECVGSDDLGQSSPPEATFVSISAGATHTCGVTVGRNGDQNSLCWGSLSHNSTEGVVHESSISGTDWSCFEETEKEGATVYSCIGSSGAGQHDVPSQIQRGTWTAGAHHGCALTSEAELTCWGANNAGQAAAPTGHYSRVISGSTSLHTCAFEDSADAEDLGWSMTCWGLDAENQLYP